MTATKSKRVGGFGFWACVGVRADGTEAVLDLGRREDVLRAYGLLWNCPEFDSVHVRDVDEKPVNHAEGGR